MYGINLTMSALLLLLASPAVADAVRIESFPVPEDAHPHDVAQAADGSVWYTPQHQGAFGRLDPKTGLRRQ